MRIVSTVLILSFLLFSCDSTPVGPKEEKGGHDHSHDHDEGLEHKGHEHKAPNGGTLVVLGEEFAHVEVVKLVEKGEFVCYIFDGGLAAGMKAEQNLIECSMTYAEMKEPLSVEFLPVVNALASNTQDSSSEFSAKVDFSAKTNIKLTFKNLKLKGQEFKDVEVEIK